MTANTHVKVCPYGQAIEIIIELEVANDISVVVNLAVTNNINVCIILSLSEGLFIGNQGRRAQRLEGKAVINF